MAAIGLAGGLVAVGSEAGVESWPAGGGEVGFWIVGGGWKSAAKGFAGPPAPALTPGAPNIAKGFIGD